jgi:hypothetical protein
MQTDDVFQHTSQLLGVDEVEWLELRFRIFAVEGNLITKNEWRAYTNSCVGGFFLNNERLLACEALERISKNHGSYCFFLAFRLAYRGDLTLSHKAEDGLEFLANGSEALAK